jgi:hypothetical protein
MKGQTKVYNQRNFVQQQQVERKPILDEVNTLQDHIDGKHIHLGHAAEHTLEQNELEQRRTKEMSLINEIYAYEMQQGNITMENGLMKFTPEVLKRLPQYRNNDNIHCCVRFE